MEYYYKKNQGFYFRFYQTAAVLLFIFIFFIAGSAIGKERHSVLFISSYHPGFPTFFQQVDGLKTLFDGRDIILDIEFMDTKRFPEKINWGNFEKSLTYKLGMRASYDVIIVADDNAFRFALDQQEKLFDEQPIVFLGVNNVDLAIQQNANPKITGVVEAVSMKETVELMLKLRPETANVIALVDDTPSGQGDLKTFYNVAKKIKSHTFSDISVSDMTWEEFFNLLSGLDEKNAVLLLSAYRDKNSSTLLFNKSLAGIKEKLPVPLFHLWYHGIGDGILGGKVINHFEQGKAAAEIVLQILDGKTVKGIKVVEKSPNQYVFDFNQLKKYNLPESILPENSLILNKPYSFYDDYKKLIWFVVCVVSILTIALFFAIINIVLRKRVEIKLRFSEIKHKEMIANISDVIAILDPQGTIMYKSPNIKKFFGWDQYELIGRDGLTTAHPDDAERIRKEFKQLVESERSITKVEYRYRCKDESYKWIELKAVNLISDPMINGILLNYCDITERKIAEKELNLSNKRYQTLFQQSPIPLWEEDFTEVYQDIEELKGENVQDFRKYIDSNPSFLENCSQKVKILDVNQEALKLHDAKTKEELLGNIDKIFTKKSLETFKEEIIAISKEVFKFESEGEVKTLSGEKKAILLKMAINREGHNSYRALIATMDITDRSQMEERLRQAQKIESIGNLAGGIAHDFNNLLFPILGMSEMLLEDLSDDSLEYENAKEIFYAAKRAGDLVKQILTFSRQSEHQMTPIRMQNVLKEVLKLCRSTIPSNIEIHENIQQNCGLVMADPTQVHQIAMNLITNAFHAVEEKNGVIDISLKEISLNNNELPDSVLLSGQYVRLSVSDNGIGMTQNTIIKIFEPYFTTKKQGKGTGLGLAVVYGIVKEHKGEIKVYSEDGEGTTFNVYLPLMKKPTEALFDIQEGKLETGTERILLVEDEESVVRLEKQMLERLGYKVSARSNSLEALETFNSNPYNYDLVISDMTMPNMTGDQLARELMLTRPDIPIIICTGFSERINEEHAEVIGVKGFLMKPVVKYDMAKMVRNVLDNTKNS